jgi:hypothetical protein
MNLDLTHEESAALTKELHDIVENDRYPFSPRIRTLREILGQAQAAAGPRAFVAAKGLRAAASDGDQAGLGWDTAEGKRRHDRRHHQDRPSGQR